MKKYLIVIFAAVVAAAVIFSCKKDDGNNGGGGEVVVSAAKMKVSLFEKGENKYEEAFRVEATTSDNKVSSLKFTTDGESYPMTVTYHDKKISFALEELNPVVFFNTPYSLADSLVFTQDSDYNMRFKYKYDNGGMLNSFVIDELYDGENEEGIKISDIKVNGGDYTGFKVSNPSHDIGGEKDTTYTYEITYSSASLSCPFSSPDLMGFIMTEDWYDLSSGKFGGADEVGGVFMSIDALPFFAQKSSHEISSIKVTKSWNGGTPATSTITPEIAKDGSNRVTSIIIPVENSVLAPIFIDEYNETKFEFTKIKIEFEY